MLTKESVRATMAKLEALLVGLNLPGFKLALKGCSYRDTITAKLEIMPIASDGTVVSKEAEEFKALAPLYGLKPEHLGAAVTVNGTDYTIVGLARKSRRFPILAKRNDGKVFKLPAESVRMKLA